MRQRVSLLGVLCADVVVIAVGTLVYRAGEVGLAGELRPASHMEARVGAAQQAGMSHCVVAAGPDAQASALAARVKRAGM